MKNKKKVIGILVGVYIVVMVCATFFVPVKAYIVSLEEMNGAADIEANSEYGYYPIWAVQRFNQNEPSSNPTPHSTRKTGGIQVYMKINVTSWLVQYVFVTLVFANLIFQAYKQKEISFLN